MMGLDFGWAMGGGGECIPGRSGEKKNKVGDGGGERGKVTGVVSMTQSQMNQPIVPSVLPPV